MCPKSADAASAARAIFNFMFKKKHEKDTEIQRCHDL